MATLQEKLDKAATALAESDKIKDYDLRATIRAALKADISRIKKEIVKANARNAQVNGGKSVPVGGEVYRPVSFRNVWRSRNTQDKYDSKARKYVPVPVEVGTVSEPPVYKIEKVSPSGDISFGSNYNGRSVYQGAGNFYATKREAVIVSLAQAIAEVTQNERRAWEAVANAKLDREDYEGTIRAWALAQGITEDEIAALEKTDRERNQQA